MSQECDACWNQKSDGCYLQCQGNVMLVGIVSQMIAL